MKYDPLVYGKNQQEGIVSIEINDSHYELFIQNPDGSIRSEFHPNKFWLLSNKKINKSFVRLKGNSHYCWGQQFNSEQEMKKMAYVYDKKYGEDIYRVYNQKEALMIKDGLTYFKGLEPKDLSVLSFDIETTGLDPNARDSKIICLSVTYRDKKGTQKLFGSYNEFKSQGDLIKWFCYTVRTLNPSIILGHNIIQFDLKYLQGIADQEGVKLELGRDGSEIKWGHPNYKKKFRVDGNRDLEFDNCAIYGREVIDTYFLAQAFDVLRTMENYKLKPLIKQLGLEIANRAYYDAEQIRHNYKNPVEFEKIIAYCKDDSDDPIKLWDKMGSLFFHLAPMIPKSFQEIVLGASGSKLNSLMVRAYLQDGHSIPKASQVGRFDGAISFAIPGIYSNCFKIDLAALYPSIILEYNVYDEDKDPNAYLVKLVRTFRAKRLEYKAKAKETGEQIWTDMDNAAKSILNSFYGFLTAVGLNYNSLEAGSFIAAKGVEILKYTIKHFSGKTFEELVPDYYEDEEVS